MTWDPDQPRDPDGKWGDGMPSIIAAQDLSLGGHQGSLTSMQESVLLDVAGVHLDIDRDYTLKDLLSVLRTPGGVQEVLGPDYEPVLEFRWNEEATRAELEFVGEDLTLKLSGRELDELSRKMERAEIAKRVKAISGQVDVWLGDRTFAIRTAVDGNGPVTLEFDEKSWRKIQDALLVVDEGFDEMGTFVPEGTDVSDLTVATNNGQILVQRTADSETRADQWTSIAAVDRDDWYVTFTGVYEDPFRQATDALQIFADAEGFYHHSAAVAAARRVPGGTPMRASERKTMHRAFGYVDRTALRDGAPLRVVMASEGRMADNIDLRMSGADLARFRSNPVLGYGHSYWGRENLPIGRVSPESLAVDGQLLAGDLEFDEDDDFAQLVERKMRGKFLNAVSIGFEVLQWESAEDSYWRGGVATKWELTELSVVPVPMDASAVVTAGRGLDLADPGLIAEVGKYSEPDFARLIRRLRALNGVLKPAEPEPDTTTTRPPAVPSVAATSARGLLDAFTITKESHA